MCASCKTPNGKFIAIRDHINRLGTYKATLGSVVQCKNCLTYYLVDSFSPAIEEKDEQWYQYTLKDISVQKQ
jgi:hypothetical protein